MNTHYKQFRFEMGNMNNLKEPFLTNPSNFEEGSSRN